MALPKLIRDPRVIASVHEGPPSDEADLSVNWDRQPVEIGIGDHVPEVTQHALLFEQLVRLAEGLAMRDHDIRRRASWQYLEQLANRLFGILVHTDLYRPVSRDDIEHHMAAEEEAATADVSRSRARAARRRGRGDARNVVDFASRRPRDPQTAQRSRRAGRGRRRRRRG